MSRALSIRSLAMPNASTARSGTDTPGLRRPPRARRSGRRTTRSRSRRTRRRCTMSPAFGCQTSASTARTVNGLRPVRLERVRALEHLEPSVDDDRAPRSYSPACTPGPLERREQPDARVLEQRVVEIAAVRLSRDVRRASSARRSSAKYSEREARAVRHDDVVPRLDAVLLGKDQLAKTVLAAHPVATSPQDAPRSVRCRCRRRPRATASTTRAPMSRVLARPARSSRATAAARSPVRAASPLENALDRRAERLAEPHAIARPTASCRGRTGSRGRSRARPRCASCGESRGCARRCAAGRASA